MCPHFGAEKAGIDQQVIQVWLVLTGTVIAAQISVMFIIASIDEFLRLVMIQLVQLHDLFNAVIHRRKNVNV